MDIGIVMTAALLDAARRLSYAAASKETAGGRSIKGEQKVVREMKCATHGGERSAGLSERGFSGIKSATLDDRCKGYTDEANGRKRR